jgi:hypothetical protein
MATSESPLQELSNEWSCQYVSTILNVFVNFCVLPLATSVTISLLSIKPEVFMLMSCSPCMMMVLRRQGNSCYLVA